MNLTELSKKIHQGNRSKGFYDDEVNIGEKLALVHSEVSEALEAHRKGHFAGLARYRDDLLEAADIEGLTMQESDIAFKESFEKYVKNSFEDEIADVIIRCLDLCGFMDIDIESHVSLKLNYNKLRAYKHGKKY